MDEKLASKLEQAIDHHPDYDLEAEDMLVITKVTLGAFEDYIKTLPEANNLASALSTIMLALPTEE